MKDHTNQKNTDTNHLIFNIIKKPSQVWEGFFVFFWMNYNILFIVNHYMKHICTLSTVILLIAVLAACTKNNVEALSGDFNPNPADTNIYFSASNLDSLLFAAGNADIAWTYFQNSPNIRPSDKPASGHSAYFVVRFNEIAAAALNADGSFPADGVFPNGSLIVKELFTDAAGNNRTYFAYMAKDPNNPFAAKGWLWSEQFVNGDKFIDTKDKGRVCTDCHSNNHIDFTRVFTSFP